MIPTTLQPAWLRPLPPPRAVATPLPIPPAEVPPPRRSVLGWLSAQGRAGLDMVLPHRCIGCGILLADQPGVCPRCWGSLTFLTEPQCSQCGVPFPFDPGEPTRCGACVRQPPPFERARAALVYDEHSRHLALNLKYHDAAETAGPLAAMMLRAGAALVRDADVVVAVPLHRRRIITRGFNQAAVLAHAIGRQTGLPVRASLLRRRNPTAPQGGLGRRQRFENVRGAFTVAGSARHRLDGHRVLLIDDVLTTGATVSAAASALLAGGAGAVDVLTIARVVAPSGTV